jgi:hypothetical protein
MPTLKDAEAALTAAHQAHDAARIAAQKAAADAVELRAKLRSGRGSKITAAQIAEADQKAEHAALAVHGAAADFPYLSAAVQAARVDELCDQVLAELPQLGRDVALALEAIEAVSVPLAGAVERFDSFVEQATHRLQTIVPQHADPPTASAPPHRGPGRTAASPFGPDAETTPAPVPAAPIVRSRVNLPRHGHPTVDGVPVSSCRGASQLAAIVCPIFEQLGAHHGLIEALKLLAAGAPQLPS